MVRFQGGHNAGHTLVIDGITYKLSLLPSGVVRPGKLSIIGNGVVFDPWAFIDEIERLAPPASRSPLKICSIAENAALILPLHRELDSPPRMLECRSQAIGTTNRGIGPAYEDKVGRRALRVIDLADRAALPTKIERLLAHHNALRRGLGPNVDGTAILAALDRVAPQSCPSPARPGGGSRGPPRGQAHPFEGAQARCSTSITAPTPLSPRPIRLPAGRHRLRARPGRDRLSCSASPRPIRRGSAKDRSRPEQNEPLATDLGTRGHEFGTNTVAGRKRRCGWFDAVLVRQTARFPGLTALR